MTSLVLRLGFSYEDDEGGPSSLILKCAGTSRQAGPDRPARQCGSCEREAHFHQELAERWRSPPLVLVRVRCSLGRARSPARRRHRRRPGRRPPRAPGHIAPPLRRGARGYARQWWQSPRLWSCDFPFRVKAANGRFLATAWQPNGHVELRLDSRRRARCWPHYYINTITPIVRAPIVVHEGERVPVHLFAVDGETV